MSFSSVTNFLGNFDLAVGLHPWLKRAGGEARVVSVASTGSLFGPIFWDDQDFNFVPYDALLGYAQSKTACILLSVAIANRWEKDGITSNARPVRHDPDNLELQDAPPTLDRPMHA